MVSRRSTVPVQVCQEAMERIAAVAVTAGLTTLRHYHDRLVVHQKGERGPVTDADRDAHEVIVTALSQWDGCIPIISEEGLIPDALERRNWRRFWLVDPLDGTKEFIRQNGEFTINIALIEDGVPVLGAIAAPARGLLYYAGKGLGAWKRADGKPSLRLCSRAPRPGQALRVVESRSHPSPALEAYLATLRVAERVAIGSSMKFCLVAEGRADLYPRMGPTMEWDVAAGDCIFRNSGADGPRFSPLVYNQPDLRNPGFVLGWGRDHVP